MKHAKFLILVVLASSRSVFAAPAVSLPVEQAVDRDVVTEAVIVDSVQPSVAAGRPDWLSRSGLEPVEGPARNTSTITVLRPMVALMLILVGLAGAHWALRRRAIAWVTHDARSPRVVGRVRLGGRQELVTVEWDGGVHMLGVSPGNIAMLSSRSSGAGSESDLPDRNPIAVSTRQVEA